MSLDFEIPDLRGGDDNQEGIDGNTNTQNLTMPSPFKRILHKTSQFEQMDQDATTNYHEEQIKKIHLLEYELSSLQNESVLNRIQHDKTVEQLERQLKGKDEEIEKLNNNEKFLFEQNQELKTELKELKENHNNVVIMKDTEIMQLRRSVGGKQDQLTELKYTLESSRSKNEIKEEQYVSEIEKLKAQVVDIEEELDRQRELNGKYIRQLKSYEEQEQGQQHQQKAAADNEQDHDEINTLYKAQFSKQVDQITSLEQKLQEYESKLTKLSSSNEMVQVLKEERLISLKKLEQLKKLSEENDALILKLNRLEQEQLKWEQITKSKGSSPQEFLNHFHLIEHENQFLNEKVLSLTMEADNATKKSLNLQSELSHAHNEIEKLQKDSRNLQILQTQSENARKLLESEIAFNKSQIEMLSMENKMLLSKEGAATGYSHDTNNEEQLKRVIEEYKSQLTSSMNNFKTQVNNELGTPSKRQRLDDEGKNETMNNKNDMVLKLELNKKIKQIELIQQDLAKATQTISSLQEELTKQKQNTSTNTSGSHVAPVEGDTVSRKLYDDLLFEQKNLQDKLYENTKKLTRLREAFEKQITKFNKIIYRLFGCKIEFQSEHKFLIHLLNIAHIQVAINSPDIDLEINPSVSMDTNTISNDVIDQLYQNWIGRSIPCFISALTLTISEAD